MCDNLIERIDVSEKKIEIYIIIKVILISMKREKTN